MQQIRSLGLKSRITNNCHLSSPVYYGDIQGQLRFEAAGDPNNDGTQDLNIIYPDGQSQELFLFPVSQAVQ